MFRLTVFSVCFLAFTASAQWSSDSTVNLQICDLAGEQVLPKIQPTSDGGCFVSWFDQRSGSYCVYLQRLNYQGEPQFTENGLLVSDHPQQTWLVDYSMAVDNEDNAVLAFSDVRFTEGELDVAVYKISGAGNFLWGPDGINLSDTTEAGFEPNPSVAVTQDNNCVFSWGKSASAEVLIFQKLAPDGTKLWGNWGIVMESPDSDLSSPVLIPSGQDSVIAMWKNSTGSFPMTVTHLYADMFDIDGNGTWGSTPVLIYDGGAITPWSLPEMIPDGSGGAVCSWYDAPSLSEFNVWVQHLNKNGSILYPMNGAQASTNSSDRLHMNPSAAFDPATGSSCVFWVETDGNQNLFGLYGQMFDTAGNRQWSDSGLELLPLGGAQISFADAVLDENGIFVSYMIDTGGTSLRVLKLNFDGTVQWGPITVSAASLGSKDDPVTCTGYSGSVYFSWSDGRTDNGVYAQNIMDNGDMGPYMGIESSPVVIRPVTVSPNPSTGTVRFSVSIESAGLAAIDVFDVTGRLVDTAFSGELEAGAHDVLWSRRGDICSGLYLIRFRESGGESVSKMVLM